MRIGIKLLAAFSAVLATGLFTGNSLAIGSDSAAVQYYFAGGTDLAANTNFTRAKAIFGIPPGQYFVNLVLDRWAGVFWNAFQFDPGGDSSAVLSPILRDLVNAESMGSFGGHDKNRMGFVLAARLDAKSAETWQKNLEGALHGPGEALTEAGFSGQHWTRAGNQSIWILRARDWTVVGRGEDFSDVRAAYLQHIKQDNRPAPAPKDHWLSVDVDWPLLATWVSLPNCPFRLARTVVDVDAGKGRMHATAHIVYPEAVSWNSGPWHIPKDVINAPLASFAASQDLGAYLKPSPTLSQLSSHPLDGQLFCWASREFTLQNYAAWPVTDATNALRQAGATTPAILNSMLAARDHTRLDWMPKKDLLVWSGLQLVSMTLNAAHKSDGDFLLAELFPMEQKHGPVSEQLWQQFEGHNDLVYYDWEITGLRLKQWRLLSEILPVFVAPTHDDEVRYQKAARNSKAPVLGGHPLTPLAITESWLAELTPVLDNTVTEVRHTSPTELTAVRSSEFLFTGLELVALSHWLADAPIGPLDKSLLPYAKMTGPGMPRTP